MRMRWVPAIVAAVLLLAGCGSGEPDVPAYPKAPIPADRDPAAVFAALSRIDPCVALADALRQVRSSDDAVFPSSPHTCRANTEALGFVTVTVGAGLPTRQRFRQQQVVLGGAKGYQRSLNASDCTYTVPTSFTTGVEIGASEPGADCGPVRALADRIASRLDSTPGKSTWDACSLLNTTLRRDGRGVVSTGVGTLGLDSCGYGPAAADGGSLSATTAKVSVQLSYGTYRNEPSDGEQILPVAGHRVLLNEAVCAARWSQGRSGETLFPARNVDLLIADGCPDLRGTVEKLVRALDGPPPDTAPQRPLTYRPQETDAPAAGGCVDYTPGAPCEPYHRATVPTDRDELLAAAQVDKNVACAVAMDAVRGRLGPDYRAVTTGNSGCVFVEPTHRVQLTVRFSETALEYLHSDQPEFQVAGHPAKSGTQRLGQRVSVGAGRSAADDGYVEFVMSFELGTDGAAPDMSRAALLRPLAGDVVRKYLR